MALIVNDTFTESVDTALGSHTPDKGGAYVQHPASAQGMTVIAAEGRCRGNSTTATSFFYNDVVPSSAEYTVEATIRVTSTSGSYPGLAARMNTSGTLTAYIAFYDPALTRLDLQKVVGGTPTSLGTYTVTLSPDTDYALKLEAMNAAKKVFLNGVERISHPDNTITDTGKPGLRARQNGRVDNFTVNDPVVAGQRAAMGGGLGDAVTLMGGAA